MDFQTIRVERDGPACVLRLDRPEKRNAVSLRMMDEIVQATTEAAGDGTTRAIVIAGGDAVFSAGADLNEAFKVKSAIDGRAYFGAWHRLNRHIEELPLPVIAAIEGICVTGGLELALACDLRIGAEGSSFAVTSARIGTVAGAGGTQRLPRLVGTSAALAILFSADPIDADEALRIGLINRKTAKGAALAEAKALAAVYAERAPLSLAFVKRAVHRGVQMDLESAIEFETYLVTTVYGTEDKAEGIGAFLEKRPAVFKGR